MEPPPAKPHSRAATWALIALLWVLAASVAGAVWVVYETSRVRTPPPPDLDFEERVAQAGKELSLRRMVQLRDALFSYRDQFGGGQRLPARLDELLELALLPPDFDFQGPLSRRPFAFRPEIPAAEDPSRWILVHDRLFGRTRATRGYGSAQGVTGAVVMFADGKVRWLDEKEAQQFAGLNDALPSR